MALEDLEELLEECRQRRRHSIVTEVAQLLAGAETGKSAGELDADCVSWYAPAQAKITGVKTGAGGDLRVGFEVRHGTRFTFWHRGPGDSTFQEVVRETKEKFVTLTGLVAGEHRFKVQAANSRGEGPESKETVIRLTA